MYAPLEKQMAKLRWEMDGISDKAKWKKWKVDGCFIWERIRWRGKVKEEKTYGQY